MVTESDLLIHGLSKASSEAYTKSWKEFETWCQANGRSALPASVETMVEFIKSHEEKWSASTLSRAAAAIAKIHVLYGARSPVQDEAKFILKSLEAQQEPNSKKALTKDEFETLVRHTSGQSLKDMRDKAMLLLGVYTGMPIDTLVALQTEHIVEDNGRWTIEVDDYRVDFDFAVEPIPSLSAWLNFANIEKGYVFRNVRKNDTLGEGSIGSRQVNRLLKNLATKAGLDAKGISYDSLRRSFQNSVGQKIAVVVQKTVRPRTSPSLQRALSDLVEVKAQEKQLLQDWVEASERAEALSKELNLVTAQLQQIRQATQAHTVTADSSTQDLLRSLLSGSKTPEECLQLLATAYPERIVVLPSAVASAQKARAFRFTDKLLQLFDKLATVYFEALASGKGDTGAYAYMGWSYAANDSFGSASAKKRRVFEYKGQDILMEKHLRIGQKPSPSETIRVHFEWIAPEKKIVIGWCGRHLE